MDKNFDFETIQVDVDFPGASGHPFLNRQRLHDNLTDKAAEILREYGLHAEKGRGSQRGGGIDQTLWEIIKNLWEQRHFIAIGLTIFRHIQSIARQRFAKQLSDSKPHMIITLGIFNSSPLIANPDGKELQRLILLRHLSDTLKVSLSSAYSMITFSQVIYIWWGDHSNQYRVSIQLEKTPGVWGSSRINAIIKQLKPRPNFDQKFSVKGFLIKRVDSTINNVKIDDTYYNYPSAKYFLFISSSILRDRMKNILLYRRSKIIKV